MLYLITTRNTLFTSDKYTICSLEPLFKWAEAKEEVQVDTETNGFFDHNNVILTLQIGDADTQFVIDFQCLTTDQIQEISDRIMNNSKILKILHNAKFDIKFLWRHGMDICNVYDTMLAEIILNAGRDMPKGYYSLYSCGRRYCNIEMDKSIRGEINRIGLTTQVIQYAADDVKYLSRIKKAQLQQLVDLKLANPLDISDRHTVLGLENRAVIVFASIEYNGIKLDLDKWEVIEAEILDLVKKDKDAMDKMVLDDIRFKAWHHHHIDLFSQDNPEMRCILNWNSPKQKLEMLKILDKGFTSTDQRTLDKYKHKYPLVSRMIQYSKHNKLYSAFAKALRGHINPHTGRIHPNFWQILATGRVSCREPNLQQIPSRTEIGGKMRTAFVAEPGKKMVGGDYSGCELRVIAFLSKDPVWLKVFQEDGDLHSELCVMTFGIPLDKVKTPSHFKPDLKYRDIQKTIDFGLAYGMSEFKLADTMEVSVEVAREIIEKFFNAVPDVKKFLDKLGRLAKNRGYIKTPKPYSRYRWFDGWENKEDFKRQGEIERAGKNTPIQGANADLVKLALVNVYESIKENNYPVKIINVIHDEIQTEVDEEFAEEWSGIMQDIMVDAGKAIVTTIPMSVDCTVSDHWTK
jgi:DNA polymerase-1